MFPFTVNNRITSWKEFTGKLLIEILASIQRKPNRVHFRIFKATIFGKQGLLGDLNCLSNGGLYHKVFLWGIISCFHFRHICDDFLKNSSLFPPHSEHGR